MPSHTPQDKKNKTKKVLTKTKTKVKKKDSAESPNGAVPHVPEVMKRDGSIVGFDPSKIVSAIHKAMKATGEGSLKEAELVANNVVADVVRIKRRYEKFMPTVEGVQDAVEKELMKADYFDTAKAYILYREERAKLRAQRVAVPDEIKDKFKESKKYLENQLSEFVFYTSYSRWSPEKGRRETWVEAVDRYMDFMKGKVGDKLSAKEYKDVRQAILDQDVCPSMRLLWAAGPAAERSNVAAYNCSFVAPTRIRDFAEVMYILMNGTGAGYSVESEFIEKLPQIKRQTGKKLPTHVVEDDRIGWAEALRIGMETWFDGNDIEFDFSQVRPAGARLRTMGGKASGPDPLRKVLSFTREKILARQGKRLRTIDAHDIMCEIGEVVVAGGVRRSALISLSDLDDQDMRDAKKGQFYISEPQRSMANNSAVYLEKPSAEEFLEEWTALVKSQSGERGIFNAAGLEAQLPERRVKLLKEKYGADLSKAPVRTNPCGEIYLQSRQFCNLTSIVIREDDTAKTLKKKMAIATLLGTYQSTLTDFEYLSEDWKKNSEEERLLGVSLTGYYDNSMVRDDKVLQDLKKESIKANKKYAKKLGVGESTCITCVKPHGNSSQLLDTASGMHPRFAEYYIRRVRVSATDAIFKLLKDQGVPCHPEVGQSMENATTFVLEFPIKSPKGAVVKDDISALELLSEWKRLKLNFTEHNPSSTIYIGPKEWVEGANFVYDNWDYIGGLSFLPRNDHVYQLAPYEEITKEEYEKRLKEMGEIDFSKLYLYENDDETKGAKELACVGGVCEIDDALAIEANEKSSKK